MTAQGRILYYRHAGRSRVSYYGFTGHTMSYHAWRRGARLHVGAHLLMPTKRAPDSFILMRACSRC